ncbi:MAG: triose-phosphate isomerase [Crocinitomicaceae bacterium]|jgi:triosephosphate isomerase|nr:triose-phosphate isomerase [Crocinitomicaceae bacterium]|tara:strand:+ start:4797 stop:5537 length:741 start_codon:yes stop_codon:yes gene_type:complete
MAQKIVAGNWKMNLELNEAKDLIKGIKNYQDDVRVIVFPSSVFINVVAEGKNDNVEVGTQNFHTEPKGAFTGELSISQLRSAGATVGLIGHSERRAFFSEGNELIKMKVNAAITNNFDFIFCCGEPLMIREAGKELEFIKMQLEESLFHLTKEQMMGKVIAYEPVWAIGSGMTASSDQAESMHRAIRTWIHERYDDETAQNVSILYGGSCNQDNAKVLFSCPNVDGGLIGGASLIVEAFCTIIDSY